MSAPGRALGSGTPAARLALHLGLHKTGTSFLQQRVFPDWPGVHYLGKPWRPGFLSGFLEGDDGVALASDEHFSCPGLGNTIIARERGGPPLHTARAATLARVSGLFPGAGVMVGFRPPADFADSAYSNYLLFGGRRGPEDFYRPDAADAPLARDDLAFLPVLETVARLWPKVFPFELSELAAPAPLFAAMGAFLGVEAAPRVGDGPIPNQRLTRRKAEAALALNRGGEGALPWKEQRRRLVALRDGPPDDSGPVRLPEAARAAIAADLDADWRACRALIAALRAGD